MWVEYYRGLEMGEYIHFHVLCVKYKDHKSKVQYLLTILPLKTEKSNFDPIENWNKKQNTFVVPE